MTGQAGQLYLCATPIGNLEDMTYRVVRILREVAVIAAEDTRHTRKLLSHFDLHTPLISYHEHNKLVRGPELVARMLNGEDVAVVSDAGMPGISDPGAHLAVLAIEAGITVVPLPGANAALAALVASGLDTTSFIFVGFLPKTKKKRQELLATLAHLPQTMILYEAPHRVRDTLAELNAAFGDRPAVACRELTKKFEEFVRGSIATLDQHFSVTAPRGEFTLVVAGAVGEQLGQPSGTSGTVDLPLAAAVAALVDTGINKKDAIKMVASERGLARRLVYQAVLDAAK